MRAAHVGLAVGLFLASATGQAGASTTDQETEQVDAVAPASASKQAQASWWLSPGGKAYHFNRKKNYNEENYGLGLEYGTFESSWQAGFYRNSHRKDSYYAMYAWRPIALDQAGYWRLGAVAGLVTGYKNRYFDDVMPIIMPTLAAQTRHVGVSFYAVPKISGLSPAMLMLHLHVRI